MSDWTKAPALPSMEWEHIQTQTLAVNAAGMTFSGINTAYRRFQIHGYIVARSAVATSISMTVNNEYGTTNYEFQEWDGGINSGAGTTLSTTRLLGGVWRLALSIAAGQVAAFWATVQKADATLPAKYLARSAMIPSTTYVLIGHNFEGRWVNVDSLISRLDFSSQMAAGSHIALSGARNTL